MIFPSSLHIGDRRYKPEQTGTLPADQTFVRVLHEAEVPAARRNVPPKMPEVRALFPNHFVRFGQAHQALAWKLNPLLRAGNMTAVYDDHLWIANDNGFSNSSDPRENYFENTNLGYPLPKVESLTCGGNLLHVIGEIRTKTGGTTEEDCYIVETLDGDNPPPSLEWLEARPWLITHAVKLDGDGKPTKFPQGYSHLGFTPGVRHPLLADPSRYTIVIPKWRCVRWTGADAPDPYRIYNPL
jgi:hypothetical protein